MEGDLEADSVVEGVTEELGVVVGRIVLAAVRVGVTLPDGVTDEVGVREGDRETEGEGVFVWDPVLEGV